MRAIGLRGELNVAIGMRCKKYKIQATKIYCHNLHLSIQIRVENRTHITLAYMVS